MLYMLDIDTCSYIIREHPLEVLATMQNKAQSGDDLVVSVITYAELKLGAERSAQPRKYNKAVALFSERLDAILPWNKSVADEFANIQSRLLKKGTPIGDNDAMIAAHARQADAVLVTNNRKHFSRVPRLKLDNWVLPV